MTQNRNKLIELFISNLSNSIIHEILEKATKQDELIRHYNSELLNSLNLAKKYRDKVNPPDSELPCKDAVYIKNKTTNRVGNELRLRISKGYTNIDLNLIEFLVNKYLKETKVVE